jgi:UbiD family decarboxylase
VNHSCGAFREYVVAIREAGYLTTVSEPADPYLSLAAQVHNRDESPLWFSQVEGSSYPVAAGLCSRRELLALGLGVPVEQLLFALADALEKPTPPPMWGGSKPAPCQEVVEGSVDLDALPILTHLPADGGPYVTAGVAIVNDPEVGRNMAFHRLLRLDSSRFVGRLIERRGTHTALSRSGGELEVAICIGNSPAVLLAAAMSPEPGVDELSIAHSLAPTPLVRCRSVALEVPAAAEIVLEGRITPQMVDEGPFLDLTETMDVVRQQPVIEIQCITHRSDACYQALLPGGLEHKLLMGLPREPTIYNAVSQVCECLNVVLTPGGGSWLHGVVQIRKNDAADGHRAIEAAFAGHGSLKHVLVVDEDINIYDAVQLEWALATRFQADRDLMVWPDKPGSSLDPSGHHVPGFKSRTAKMGLDATIPWLKPDGTLRSAGERAAFRQVRYSAA